MKTKKEIANAVLTHVRPGSIVLLHDGGGDQSATINALPTIIKGIRKMGLRLVTIPGTTEVKAHTQAVVDELRAVADSSRRPGMARVGINVTRAIGVSMPACRRIARAHRGDHGLAIDLWRTKIHEARILASMVDDPALVTAEQMEEWVAGFDCGTSATRSAGTCSGRPRTPSRPRGPGFAGTKAS